MASRLSKAFVRAADGDEIERASGLSCRILEEAAQVYVDSEKVICVYGMGLPQHVHGFDNVAMLVNLLLLKGNIGRDGTGICPVRGHSNVQGPRTSASRRSPQLVPLDKLAAMYGFKPPREKGLNTVEACEGMRSGAVKAFVGLGGNFVRAIPEREAMERAWTGMRLTVQVATKLNRSHLVNGQVAYLLPCLGRTEESQVMTVEDSLSCIHGSLARRTPASEHLLSELAIVAGLARATLAPNPRCRGTRGRRTMRSCATASRKTYPDLFPHFNQRLFTPGGFYKGNKARERIWKTESGKAEFTVPKELVACGFGEAAGRYRVITLRSNDQFNTTIYGYSDRMRGIEGTREVLLINPDEMVRAGLGEGDIVALVSDAEDGVHREVGGLKVTPFALPTAAWRPAIPNAIR